MYVKEIWRYPVKSMAGETLDAADITQSWVLMSRKMSGAGAL